MTPPFPPHEFFTYGGLTGVASTQQGLARSNNEDGYGHKGPGCFVVTDGLGGHPDGEVATRMVVDLFLSEYSGADHDPRLMTSLFLAADSTLHNHRNKMGTVPVLAWIDTTERTYRAHVCHVGDARAYLYRKEGNLTQLTTDQGALNAVWSAVGGSHSLRAAEIKYATARMRIGDGLLLATDGFHRRYRTDQIERVLCETRGNPRRLAPRLAAPQGDDSTFLWVIRR